MVAVAQAAVAFSASQVPADDPVVEPSVLEKVRAAYLAAPTTERLRVTIQSGNRPPRRSLLLARLEPSPDGGSLARAVIRAGRLLIQATPGTVRAILDRPESGLFEATSRATDVRGTLNDLLPPLPLAALDLASEAVGLTGTLTPYARGVTFDNAERRQKSGAAVLEGACNGGSGSVKLSVDAGSGRIRRVEIVLEATAAPAARTTITIEHAASSADLAGVDFESSSRVRVLSLAGLAAGEPDIANGTRFRVTEGTSAAHALDNAVGSKAGVVGGRPALVLLGRPPTAGGASVDLQTAAGLLAAVCAEFAGFRDGLGAEGDAGFAMLWQTVDAAEDAVMDRAIGARAEGIALAGLDGVEGELARIAPGAGAAFVLVAADLTILSVHPVEQLSPDPEQRAAELVMALLEAAGRVDAPPSVPQPEPTQGP